MKITYDVAGVDIKEGYRTVEAIKKHVKRTYNANVLNQIGSFGGLFKLPIDGLDEPVLVSGTDGVGTKLKIAFMMNKHDTVGQDLVAMCVNDVLCQGAMPLFFLDYLATGKLNADKVAAIVSGIAEGCHQSGCALIGGETAEMPGFYGDGEYDMAGFTVGLVDKSKIIDGSRVKAGDQLIGLASSGFHSNGYSLIRKLIFDVAKLGVDDIFPSSQKQVGEVLLTPTKIYAKALLTLFKEVEVKAAAHITGGGVIENIPRCLPTCFSVQLNKRAWRIPAIFNTLQTLGQLEDTDMFNTFNMGIGFVIVVDKAESTHALDILKAHGEIAWQIGEVVVGRGEVLL